jgi:hypothetical protein
MYLQKLNNFSVTEGVNKLMHSYYEKTTHGINHILEFYTQNASYTVNGVEENGPYNAIINYTKNGIHRIEYANLNGDIININCYESIVNVHGMMKQISLWGFQSNWQAFNELLIVQHTNEGFFIKKSIIRK